MIKDESEWFCIYMDKLSNLSIRLVMLTKIQNESRFQISEFLLLNCTYLKSVKKCEYDIQVE